MGGKCSNCGKDRHQFIRIEVCTYCNGTGMMQIGEGTCGRDYQNCGQCYYRGYNEKGDECRECIECCKLDHELDEQSKFNTYKSIHRRW